MRRKSYLRAGRKRHTKLILTILAIVVLVVAAIIAFHKFGIDFSFIKSLISKVDFKSIKKAQIIVAAIGTVALICFIIAKNATWIITTILYSIIYFITLGGINIMNSYWFWILFAVAELLAIIVSCGTTGDSFFAGCGGSLFQLFALGPIWLFIYAFCSYAAEKGNTELENLWYLVLQFLTFAVVFGYQMIMMYSKGGGATYDRDPVADMIGDEIDNDDYLF